MKNQSSSQVIFPQDDLYTNLQTQNTIMITHMTLKGAI